MIRPRQLLLFSLLFLNSVFGDGENNGKSQITEDLKKGNSRTDAEQEPFTSVTMATQAGDPHSTLFSTCLAASRTFEARFASIEVGPNAEYIRYVPDSFQLSYPISWKTENYTSILDCAKAAYDGGWTMFKYNGAKCEVVNRTYNLDDIPKCEENDSDAVFILSSAAIENCPLPRFFLGRDSTDGVICGLVNTSLMTFAEAKAFCLGVHPNKGLTLFVNEHPPLTVQDVTSKLTSIGYTKTNLWVDADERGTNAFSWYGNFAPGDWWDGKFPVYAGPGVPYRAAYMDKDASFKLRVSDKSFKAGVLCVTFATSSAGD